MAEVSVGEGWSSPSDNPFNFKDNLYLEYRRLVNSISEQLRNENAHRLAYTYQLPAWYYEDPGAHDATYTLKVLTALEGKGVYSPRNLRGLAEALESVQRKDLSKTVEEFIGNFTVFFKDLHEATMVALPLRCLTSRRG